TAAFTVARVEPGEMAEGRVQILTHHTEQTVWQPRWLTHPNGASGLASLVIAVADPDEAAARFARFTGRGAPPTQSGQTVRLDRGRIELMTREAFAFALPEIAIPSLPFMGAYGVIVKSLDAVEAILRSNAIAARRAGGVLIAPFPEELGKGAWLFSESGYQSLFG
ncbi:MAG: VOC family protein, partial [Burkholderiales bacterium]